MPPKLVAEPNVHVPAAVINEPPDDAVIDAPSGDMPVGGGGVLDTVTVTELFAVPPAPLQLRVKVLVAVSEPRVSLPDVALLPDQAPEAEHEVAFVDDHVSVDDPPLVTDVGFACSDTVGADGGGA
ncbi:MAG TPA: hypothetical protein VJT81_12405 [Burkholderiales bacterium]|nr:hypothetical protein [Burkholderiales bacterium]